MQKKHYTTSKHLSIHNDELKRLIIHIIYFYFLGFKFIVRYWLTSSSELITYISFSWQLTNNKYYRLRSIDISWHSSFTRTPVSVAILTHVKRCQLYLKPIL